MSYASEWSWRRPLPNLSHDTELTPVVAVAENVLTPDEADSIFFSVLRGYTGRQLHRVYSSDGLGSHIDLNSRYTHYYPIGLIPHRSRVTDKVQSLVEGMCATRFPGSTVESKFPFQLLGYEEKCQFRAHCDNSVYSAENGWVRNDPLRDITGILYLSDCVDTATRPNQYSGGELVFPNIVDQQQNLLRFRPKKGTLLMFPSSPAYQHQVTAITNGYRLAVVNWWSVPEKT